MRATPGCSPAWGADGEHVKAQEDAPFAATVGRAKYEKRSEAGEAMAAELGALPFDPRGEPVPIGDYKGFVIAGQHTGQGYQVMIQRPETEQPYSSDPIDKRTTSKARG